MKTATLFITFLSSLFSFGQEIIGRIDPNIIIKQKIISCTEWHDKVEGSTFYFNSQGLLHYFNFSADVLDSNYNLINGNFGKRELFYDENGNLIESIMSCYEPIWDSSIVLSLIKNYYYENLVIKQEYFDSPTSKPTVVRYFYNDTILIKKVKTKADSALVVSTGEKYKVESTHYNYDKLNRLISFSNFREASSLDSTSVTYHGDTTIWATFDNQYEEKSIVKSIYDKHQKEIERIYPNHRIVKWIYNKNGLLDSIKYTYLKTGVRRRTTFTYEK